MAQQPPSLETQDNIETAGSGNIVYDDRGQMRLYRFAFEPQHSAIILHEVR